VLGAGLEKEPVDGLAFDDDFVDVNLNAADSALGNLLIQPGHCVRLRTTPISAQHAFDLYRDWFSVLAVHAPTTLRETRCSLKRLGRLNALIRTNVAHESPGNDGYVGTRAVR
jgi:hypothetical protein